MVSFSAEEAKGDATDPIERVSFAPNFLIMIYPGPLGVPETVATNAPPAFFLTANDDRSPARTLSALLQKYRDARVPAEAHFFAQGGHGFNMGERSKLKSINRWPDRLADWLADSGYLSVGDASK
jgi:dienelactone hydrolase